MKKWIINNFWVLILIALVVSLTMHVVNLDVNDRFHAETFDKWCKKLQKLNPEIKVPQRIKLDKE